MRRARPAPLLAVAGLLDGGLVVVAGARSTVGTTEPATSWFGQIPLRGWEPGRPWSAGALLTVGLVVLVGLWLAAIRWQRRTRAGARPVLAVAACWAVPFALGPPLISKDVWAYAAHGLMWRLGLDPYRVGVTALAGHGPAARRALGAVDPTWRHTTSPYGPLASAIEELSARLGLGGAVGSVVWLRVVAVVAVAALAVGAAALAAPDSGRGAVLVALNPLVLVQAVSAAHAEALMGALLVGGLVAARRGRWWLAVALVCAAAMVKAPAFAVLPALLAAHAVSEPGARVRRVGSDVAVAAVVVVASSLAVPDGWGWLRGLTTPGRNRTSFAPSSLLGDLFAATGVPDATARDVGRVLALAVAAGVVAYLAVTVRRRDLAATAGWSLLAVAVLAPVIYPWYLLWGLVCLLPVAARSRAALVGLSSVATVAALTGVPTAVTSAVDAVAVLAAVTAVVTLARRWPGATLSTARAAAVSGRRGME